MSLIFDQKIDDALKVVNDQSGQDYFELLVSSLASLIDADYVLVGEVDLVEHKAHTVALWCEGDLGEPLTYELRGTPCHQVYSGDTCVYPKDIAKRFPKDVMLMDLGLEGYVGRSLKNHHGEPIGLLVAMFKQQNCATESILSLFDLFAVRAQAELERIQWERSLNAQISLLKETNKQLKLSHQVFEHTTDGMLVTDVDNNIVQVNSAFERLSGYERQELLGENPKILNSGLQSKAFYRTMWANLVTRGEWQGELWNRRKDGTTYPVWSSISTVKNHRGEITNYIASCKDKSSEKELEAKLYHQATHDYLTGLSNSYEFHDHACKVIAVAKREQEKLALVRINIDNLTLVNSSYGYLAGDILVKTIGQRLKENTRESDIVSRLGGDDFVVLIEYEQFSSMKVQLKRFLNLFKREVKTDVGVLNPSCSMGISILGDDADDLETMLKNAYEALKQAKEHSRGGYGFYNRELEAQTCRNDLIEKQLFRALSEGQIEPYFQPIINFDDMTVHHCEALARWQDEQLGDVSPAEFIPVAESSGLIRQLGEQVFAKSVQVFTEINQILDRPVGVTVNRSPAEFIAENDRLEELYHLSTENLSPELICIEITENLMMESPESALAQMQRLKKLGFNIALDDFGTGFSSLSYIKRFPLDYIKIDQSFVRDLEAQGDDFNLVKTIILMAKSLGHKTIAEGVETQEQCALLRSLGCDYGQGYLFSKPLPREQLLKFLQQN